ncbi:MAG: aminotransferase class I/II-fold pyridoxal phosphate-dependent enzyme [Gammaproteobacteria bacterium]|nr:aminotransferase class I/II-fold pyridoxal phosphate-dependent enzyme [Gammaproteobacteria bacterium]NKB64993.1 aminotransferase class I/II-fold pyridoxal phosphate-dependent enzyme [Gammaproteobacteria bacterium]
MKFSSLTERISGEGSTAWEVHYEGVARKEAGEEVIVLSVGQETDERTPDNIVNAAIESLQNGRHHYTPVNGILPLRRAIARRHEELNGQQVTAANCAVFAGAQNALYAVAQCLLEHGDEVILIEPYYTTYPAAFTASGATLVSVPVKAENGFQIDPEDIIKCITERTRAIVVNSPNNPVGAVYTVEQFQPLVNICVEKDIWLVSDEVYLEILPAEERCSPSSLPGADKVCISISSLSKSHRMTGWRLGWVVGPENLMANLKNLSMCMCYGLPPFIMDAGVEALNSGSEVANEVCRTLSRRRQILVESMEQAKGVEIYSAVGGMFVVLDVRSFDVSGQEFAWELLNRHNISILPCDGFGRTGAGLLRVSLCVSDEQMVVACQRIVEFVEFLNGGGSAE